MNRENRARQSVLSVDDDRDLRDLLHELIIDMGLLSVTAVDGMDALEKMEEEQFDIVITDINMPRLNGIGLIKRVAAEYIDTDVIAITGFQTEYNYTDIIALGASDFISKPININEFEAKIKRIVRERNMRSELRRLSTCDALTGLYNRRYLDENLEMRRFVPPDNITIFTYSSSILTTSRFITTNTATNRETGSSKSWPR